MAQKEQDTTLKFESPDDDGLRRKLLARVGIAAAIVVLLLGALVLFDTMIEREKPAKQIARVEPPTRVIEKSTNEEKPAVPAEEKAEEKPAEKPAPSEAGKEPVAEPERTEAPTVARARQERPLTPPATTKPASMHPGAVVAAQQPEPAQAIAHAAPAARPAQPAAASRPIARAVEAARQFLLQVGVFNNVANAEELRAKIESAGLPVRIETRVQVGPFASRQEVEQARAKLTALGIDESLVVAGHK